jgi:plasmid stabilization system protein ParE
VSSRLVVRPLAELDLPEAFDWYEAQQAGPGPDFIAAIESVFARIAENPKLYPTVHYHVRRAVVRRFPYLVYFVADDEEVSVLGCFHSKRRPAIAQERLGP